MKHLALASFLLALAACSSDPLTAAEGELLVRPARIDFPVTYIGFDRAIGVELENTGRAPHRIELSVEPPFAVDPAAVEVAGGATRVVRVVYTPTEERESEAIVRLSNGVEIPVRGAGLPVPECPPSDRCVAISFDPDTGRCEEVRAENGADCSDACFEGICDEGVCRGNARTCDDADVCTADACDPATGCVHYDLAVECPASADPCSAPICDPVGGCTFADAPEGTSCGPANCTTSFVCLAGTCTEVTTPEGGDCGDSSPCQEPGTCVEGACIQDPPTPLEPLWTQRAAPGATLHFDGATDGLGNVYWGECTFESCDLVSVTLRGLPRYRESLFVADVGRSPTGGVSIAGDMVVSTLAPDRIEARKIADGSLVWSRDLLAAVTGESEPPDPTAPVRWVDEAASPVIAEDFILVPLNGSQATEDGGIVPWGGWVVAVRRATGEVAWVFQADAKVGGFVGDEGGSVVFALRAHDAAPTDGGFLVSLGTTGTERWRKETPFQPPLATLGGLFLQATGQLRTTADGGEHARLPLLVPTYPQRSPLLGGRSLYVMGVPLEPCDAGSCPTWVPHLFRFDLDTGEEFWRQQLSSGQTSEPVLTSDLSVLYALPSVGGGSSRSWLTETTLDQESVFVCALPAGGRYDGAASLHQGSWITVDSRNGEVQAFGVQERIHPGKGWITAGGTPQRSNRPR